MINKLYRFIFPQAHPADIKRKYNLPDSITLNVELTKDNWFVAESPDVPGLFTQARSQEELLDMVNDAVLTYYNVPKREADYVYDRLNIGDQVVRYHAQLKTA
ncbi:MAG: type II toxin-antitoxin system HicB family antitoxin [Candidatus Komeilibacteria bacterium]|nr:type II toxin-antitoxin system HicB family antitoxin [Candidatus Komeilibacteria bacterium]